MAQCSFHCTERAEARNKPTANMCASAVQLQTRGFLSASVSLSHILNRCHHHHHHQQQHFCCCPPQHISAQLNVQTTSKTPMVVIMAGNHSRVVISRAAEKNRRRSKSQAEVLFPSPLSLSQQPASQLMSHFDLSPSAAAAAAFETSTTVTSTVNGAN